MNTIITTLTLLIFISSINSFSQHTFPDLKYTDVTKSSLGSQFGYIEPSNFKPINEFCVNEDTCFGFEIDERLLGTLKLDKKSIEFYYCEAPSEDPTFYAVCNGEIIFKEFGKTLHLKNKTLYIEGRANSYFDKKRKFVFQDGKYIETIQPLYYIGVKGKLNYSISIYQTEKLESKVATLPAGYKIEIIGGKTNPKNKSLEKLLLKTEFGLTGWVNFNPHENEKPLTNSFVNIGD